MEIDAPVLSTTSPIDRTPATIQRLPGATIESVRESVIIVLAYVVIISATQGHMPDLRRLGYFMLVYVPVVTLLKAMNADISSNIATAAGIGLGNHLFGIVTGVPPPNAR